MLADVLTRQRGVGRGGLEGRLPGIIQALIGGGRVFRVGTGGEESLQ